MWAPTRTIEAGEPGVVPLDHRAAQADVLGAKAANLARARAAGLPVIDGFVLPAPMADRLSRGERGEPPADLEQVRSAWGSLSRCGSDAVVVRSSSMAEDTSASSQAGVFESVVDVHGWDDFLDAVRTVAASAHLAFAVPGRSPLAVLVQRHIDPAWGGVLFGADPVTGRTDRLVVAAVPGGPQQLVAGSEAGRRIVLDRRGRVAEGRAHRQPLARRHRLALARLAARAQALFGGPQDIEWAIDHDGRLLLLQSRPITALGTVGQGPVLGPGPVAETFPEPLSRLEEDLWITPLREALKIALHITGGASARALDRSPVALTVAGRVAVDLDLLEGQGARRRGLALLDPRPPARRLRVAWQVGRLRAGLPGLVDDLTARLDRDLDAVPALGSLDEEELLLLLHHTRSALRAAHGFEVLAGTLGADTGATGAAAALAALAAGRRAGLSDPEIVAAHPVVLALSHPAIGLEPALPDTPHGAAPVPGSLAPREALRLRIRWLHELSARAAWALGERLVSTGRIRHPAAVARLDLATLADAVRSGATVVPPPATIASPPLPARFRLAADGTPVAVHDPDADAEGTGAGGGRGAGVVTHRPSHAEGAVLVVATLDPRLASVLPGLAGLIAETGSPLSHLAILAREHGVPTVVAVRDAASRFPAGTEVLVDGGSGEIRTLTTGAKAG